MLCSKRIGGKFSGNNTLCNYITFILKELKSRNKPNFFSMYRTSCITFILKKLRSRNKPNFFHCTYKNSVPIKNKNRLLALGWLYFLYFSEFVQIGQLTLQGNLKNQLHYKIRSGIQQTMDANEFNPAVFRVPCFSPLGK